MGKLRRWTSADKASLIPKQTAHGAGGLPQGMGCQWDTAQRAGDALEWLCRTEAGQD